MSIRPQIPNTNRDYSKRSPSALTSDSVFADSAISVGTTNLTFHNGTLEYDDTPSSAGFGIYDRLSQLAASAWAAEQDGLFDQSKNDKVKKALRLIEATLEDRVGPDSDLSTSESEKDWESTRDDTEEDGQHEQIQLQEIHNNLAATVASMRLRQKEQWHLYQLAIQKLEAVAQTCLVQEKQLSDFVQEAQDLRKENHKLREGNDALRDHIRLLEAETTQKEVAVNAMSSAVAGLEGWINSSPETNRHQGQTPRSRMTPRKTVVRGRGRFRGRYYVDEDDGAVMEQGLDGATDARELNDGVRAWLRGFRDVEEELHKAAPNKSPMRLKEGSKDLASTDDEWGDFETVSGT